MILGLDGASPYLIQEWIDLLPNIRSMFKEGVHGTLESIVPPSSVPAWQCLATGKNPAKIGIWGFISIGPDRKVRIGHTTPDIGCLWDICSRSGLKVGVFNIPGTYPPYQVNGFMVSGFPTPPGKTWADPPSLMKKLNSAVDGYEVDVPLTKPSEMRGGEKAYLAQVERLHFKSVESAKLLIQWYEPDFFMMTLQGIDMVQHDFWRYMNGPPSQYKNVIRDWYVKLDQAVGELRKFATTDTHVLICSDHGSIPVSTSLHVNELLSNNGLLTLKNTRKVRERGANYTKIRQLILKTLPPDAIRTLYRLTPNFVSHKLTVSAKLERTLFQLTDNIDWDRSLAFSTGGHQAAIYLNLIEGHDGTVLPDRGQLIQRICDLFSNLRHPTTGDSLQPIFHLRENTFPGPYQSDAPDLCVELLGKEEKIHMSPNLGSGKLWSFSPHLSAEHIREGFWAMTGPQLKEGVEVNASILDMAPTLLKILSLDFATDFDGRVLSPIFKDS